MPNSAQTLDEQHARFQALVLPHLDRLLRFAQRRTASAGDAEDAVQDACVKAWLSFQDLRDAGKARPWLYRILRSVLSDVSEKSDRRRQLVDITRLEQAHEELIGGETDVVFSEVAARLDSEMIAKALELIPEDFATAVELHDIDGFKYHEIAEIAGIPIGTVMSRISRGRRLLAGTIVANRRAWGLGASDTTSPAARLRRGGERNTP
ncbi:MAG: RNA polymerase sigma factor [Gemmatimonadaceae bacterium]|nr:RNA polymerase sigma factor [Gemmatimonadaceae bacterium]